MPESRHALSTPARFRLGVQADGGGSEPLSEAEPFQHESTGASGCKESTARTSETISTGNTRQPM